MPAQHGTIVESEWWRASRTELRHALQTPEGPATVTVRFVAHQDDTRDETEHWTHVKTFVGRVYLPLDSQVKIRTQKTTFKLDKEAFFLMPQGLPFSAEYGPGRILCHVFVLYDQMGCPVNDLSDRPLVLHHAGLARETRRAFARAVPGELDLAAYRPILHFLSSRWSVLVRSQKAWQALGPLRQILQDTPPAQWRLSELAREVGCSPAALSKRFKRVTGVPLKRYLVQLVIARAQEALSMSNAPACQVSDELGFDNPAYFHLVFQKETGLTPGAWRRLLEEGTSG